MKSNFALTLSFDGIGLLHRTQVGWHLVGDVPLEDSNLAATLAGLASKARALDPTGLHCKLVIPNEQMKYLSFETDSRDIDIIETQVRNALNGATPYPLAELAYDWSMRDGEVYVAAVAIETLTEAESFAVDHAFGPMCFVAIPEAGTFEGEPFLGETVHAGQVLGPDESVSRDEEAIRIVGAATLPEPDPVPPADPPAEEPQEVQAEPDPQPAAPDTPAPGMISFSSARRTPGGDAPEVSGTPPSAETPPDAPVVDLPKSRFTPAETPEDALAPEDDPVTDPPAAATDSARKEPPLALTDPTSPPLATSATELARTLQNSQADNAPPIRPVAKPTEPASRHPGKASFLSRRKADATDSDGASDDRLTRGAAKSGMGQSLASGFKRARRTASATSDKAAKTATPSPAQAPRFEDEKQRMTVFGARNPTAATPDGPRYIALYLTAALLLVLVGVAAWAALFLEDGVSGLFRKSEEVQIAQELPAPEAALPAAPQTPAEPEIADTSASEQEALADAPLQQPSAPEEPRLSETLSPDEARARYAATGIWQLAPEPSLTPGITVMEDFYQASLDPDLRLGDAVALPDLNGFLSDTPLATPADPLPPGEDLERDTRGFIAATAEGVVTPEGFTLFAGAPPLKPSSYPERATAALPESAERGLAGEGLAALRPKARPENLRDAFERENNGGRTLTELANIRPRLRPRSAQEIALEAAGVSPEIEADATPREDATEEAVLASLKPKIRPASFSKIVEETQQVAAAQPVSLDQQVSVSIPTTASVARAATDRNQISLRKLNLIGVYGQANNRRALVRLRNGKFKKVVIGDRLDGGEVAAIDKDALHYVKRGKSHVLKMPSG